MSIELKILMLEDSQSDCRLIKEELKKAGIIFSSVVTETEEDFIYQLDSFNPDIILSDYSLPKFNGMEALKLLKKKETITPFILITGSLSEETAVECMKAGADDYILKDNLKRIGPSIESALIRKLQIHQKLEAEKALRESEERYRKLVNINPDGIIVHKDGKILFANQAAANTFYVDKPEKLIDENIWGFVHPDSKLLAVERIGNLYATNKGMPTAEEKFIRTNGEVVYCEITSFPIVFYNENAVLVILKDITDRKIAQEAYKKAELQYSRFVETVDAIVWACEINSPVFTFVSKKAEKLLSYPIERWLNEENFWIEHMHPEDRDRIKNCIYDDDQFEHVLEYRMISADNRIVWLKDINRVVFEKDKPSELIGIMVDITKEKHQEEAIKESEKNLLIAKEKAEESSRFKSVLMSNINHELRTPMNGILGFAQILKEELLDETQIVMAENIIKSGRRLMSTLSSIIDLSILEANSMELKKNTINLAFLIKYVAKQYENECTSRNIDLNIIAKDEIVCAEIDENLAIQILKNLIENAIKFTPKGKITVECSSKLNADGKLLGLISVSDTGIGIPADQYNQIFQPFKQLSEGTNRTYEGTGLGLTISKKMIESMNGTIELSSEVGVGTTFTITFPGVESEKIVDISPKVIQPAKRLIKITHKPLVLLVEDNYINKDVTELFLKDKCVLEHAVNGEKAIELAKQKIYDIVLMDINLGAGIDGIETFKRIKSNPNYDLIPFVAITGYAMREDKAELLKTGFDYYLPKPFQKSEITSILDEIVKKNYN